MKKRVLISGLFLILIITLIKLKIFIPCMFHKITNLYCPGCGITRMVLSILKLDFYQAFRYNPLCFIISPFIFIYAFYQFYIFIFMKKDNLTNKIPNIIYIILLVILIVFGIIRNIDTFSYLKPTILK